MKPLHTFQSVVVYQDEDGDPQPKRIHYIADMDVDGDGAPNCYRLDNNEKLALDDIHASAGWPHGDWWNVLVRDPNDPEKPYVDDKGFCVSMTSYQRTEYGPLDRRRYLDANIIPYTVIPGYIREACKGVLLGCRSRVTKLRDTSSRSLAGASIEGVCGDFSGYNIGEASVKIARFFDKDLSPTNGDGRHIYLYEFFPDTPAVVTLDDGSVEHFELKPWR